jgi:hypothetical protein
VTPSGRTSASAQLPLVSASFISGVGSWLTFLGILLFSGHEFGLGAIPGALLIQSLPGVLLGKVLAGRVALKDTKTVYLAAQFALALCSTGIAFYHRGIWSIYFYLLVTSVVKIYSSPLLNSFIGLATEGENQTRTYTRVGAASSIALAIAPAAGGVIYQSTGPTILFALDALSYVIAALICVRVAVTIPVRIGEDLTRARRPVSRFLGTFMPPSGLNCAARFFLRRWYLFAIIGACLNGLEFQIMSRHSYNSTAVGVALAMWGVGNLIAIIRPDLLGGSLPAVIFAGAIALWAIIASPYIGWALFLTGGIGYAIVSGKLRGAIQDQLSPEAQNAAWGYAMQIVLSINLVVYGAIWSAQLVWNIQMLSWALGVIAVLYGIAEVTFSRLRSRVTY